MKYLYGVLIFVLFACSIPMQEGKAVNTTKVDLDTFPRFVSRDSCLEQISPLQYIFDGKYPHQKNIPLLIAEFAMDSIDIALYNNQNKGTFIDISQVYNSDYYLMMNAGMFHRGGEPVGYFLNDEFSDYPLNRDREGRGNFFLRPNGVFYLTEDNCFGVMETEQFDTTILQYKVPLQLATQSGPMLLIDGKTHPKFRESSRNLNIRNGVGVTENSVIFILTQEPINLYNFAKVFKQLGCDNALYLDGAISEAYFKGYNHIEESTLEFGPVLGIKIPNSKGHFPKKKNK